MDESTVTTVLAITFLIYMFPWVIALVRKHPSAGAVFFLNLLLGWTGIGWLWALIWSFTATRQNVHVVINQGGNGTSSESRSKDSRDF